MGQAGDSQQRSLVRLVVGALAVGVGAALTLRPFSSLDALVVFVAAALVVAGIGELLGSADEPRPWVSRVTGVVLILVGVLAAALPGLTVSSLAPLVGGGLIGVGALRLTTAARGAVPERATALLGGVACVVLGLLAMTWADVTVLLIALVVGPATVILGVRQLLRGWRGGRTEREPGGGHPRLRLAGAIAALALAGVLAGLSALLHQGSPRVHAFYDTPADLPSRPGALLREEPASNGVPADAVGRRILYTTTAPDGRIMPASALVLTPRRTSGRLPVVLWEHGTTGVARSCAPSVLPEPFKAGGMPAVTQALGEDWALVAPDYPGLGAEGRHPYLVGVPAARSALDAVRAARYLDGVTLDRRTVVWGHSQGGGATLWTGVESARGYAPDVPLAGIAALAPASDVLSLARAMQGSPSGMLFATFLVQGYDNAYADVRRADYVRAAAMPATAGIASRCLAEPAVLLSIPSVLTGQSIFSRDLTSGSLGARLRENVPLQRTGVPTLIAQGGSDELVLPEVQRRFVRHLCSAGQPVDFRAFAGRDHLSVVAADSPLLPQLLRWTHDRLAGRPARSTCA